MPKPASCIKNKRDNSISFLSHRTKWQSDEKYVHISGTGWFWRNDDRWHVVVMNRRGTGVVYGGRPYPVRGDSTVGSNDRPRTRHSSMGRIYTHKSTASFMSTKYARTYLHNISHTLEASREVFNLATNTEWSFVIDFFASRARWRDNWISLF